MNIDLLIQNGFSVAFGIAIYKLAIILTKICMEAISQLLDKKIIEKELKNYR